MAASIVNFYHDNSNFATGAGATPMSSAAHTFTAGNSAAWLIRWTRGAAGADLTLGTVTCSDGTTIDKMTFGTAGGSTRSVQGVDMQWVVSRPFSTTGSKTISASLSASLGSGEPIEIAVCIEFTGVLSPTTKGVDGLNSNAFGDANFTLSCSAHSLLLFASQNYAGSASLVSGFTSAGTLSGTSCFNAGYGDVLTGIYYKADSGAAGSQTVGYQSGGSGAFSTSGVEILATVATGPTITSQPSNQSVNTPATATFTVAATASDGGSVSYQWQRSTNGGSSYSNVSTGSGGTTNSYTTGATTVSGGTANNADQYQVLCTDTNGTTTSSAAILFVSSPPPASYALHSDLYF